jgi:hypothetical protein
MIRQVIIPIDGYGTSRRQGGTRSKFSNHACMHALHSQHQLLHNFSS